MLPVWQLAVISSCGMQSKGLYKRFVNNVPKTPPQSGCFVLFFHFSTGSRTVAPGIIAPQTMAPRKIVPGQVVPG